MDIQKKELSVNMPVATANSSVIVDSDAIVNDSKPDLLKIVHIDPSVRLTKTEVLNGKMMISGRVCYKVLYQPENMSGVSSLYWSADFSHMEENPDFEEGMICSVSADVEHMEPELINSRKIKIKSVINIESDVKKSTSVMLPLSISGDNLQTKECDFNTVSSFLQKRDIITLNESLALPAGKPNIGSLLKSDAILCNKDVKVISGKVIIKGEVVICNLYIPETGEGIDYCSHLIPFTEILDADGLSEDHICNVKTEIGESDFSLATDSDGDVRIINTNVRLGIRISADRTINEKAVCDVYSMTDDLSISYNTLNLQSLISSSDFDHVVKSSVRPKNATSLLSVYNTTAKPTVTSATASDGTVCIEGFIDATSLCICSDENHPVTVHSEEIPFKIDVAVDGCTKDMQVLADAEVNNITYNLGVSGEIDLRIVLSCHTKVYENYKMEIIDHAESMGAREIDCPSIVLYFVQKGDTLWDIAKRYHTKTEYILELNGSDCSELKCGSQLLIPRG